MEFQISDMKDYIHGLYWFGKENDYELTRFPRSSFPKLRFDIQNLSMNPSGGRICFKAITKGIGIEAEFLPTAQFVGFSRSGQYGIDLYVDNRFFQTFTPNRDGYFINLIKTDGSKEHDYTLYLPIYTTVKIKSLVIESEDGEDGKITGKHEFAVKKPIVFYGSSITQGAFASRSALTFPAIIGRRLNADIINLGFSGNGKGEPEVADLISEIDASVFVMDWGVNLGSPQEEGLIEQRYRSFLRTIKNKHPKTPILIVSPLYIQSPPWDEITPRLMEKIQVEIKAAYDEEVKNGNKLIQFIDGYIVASKDMEYNDYTVDGTHVNDLGFGRYADIITPVLKKILKI
jgi:lysophospholipase L1-like esterase